MQFESALRNKSFLKPVASIVRHNHLLDYAYRKATRSRESDVDAAWAQIGQVEIPVGFRSRSAEKPGIEIKRIAVVDVRSRNGSAVDAAYVALQEAAGAQ
jgi:hypothetical protein